jgi:hypothetical protein
MQRAMAIGPNHLNLAMKLSRSILFPLPYLPGCPVWFLLVRNLRSNILSSEQLHNPMMCALRTNRLP